MNISILVYKYIRMCEYKHIRIVAYKHMLMLEYPVSLPTNHWTNHLSKKINYQTFTLTISTTYITDGIIWLCNSITVVLMIMICYSNVLLLRLVYVV